VVDGLGPDYLHLSDTPNLDRMIHEGNYREGSGVIPSVTNVNNASVATGSFPDEHGITSNYYFDRAQDQGVFMETSDFLLRPTILEKTTERGLKAGLISSKEKIRKLLSRGATLATSAQEPSSEIVAAVGPTANIYSPEVNYWSLRVAAHMLGELDFDLVYLATTDYMMHTYPPEDSRSLEHMHMLDKLLGEIVDTHPKLEVYLTADHGMSVKNVGIDLAQVLAAEGVEAEAVPIIRDRHVTHHKNLGGACYIYLREPADYEKAHGILEQTEGIDEIYSRAEAGERFRLRRDRIGDIFLLGKQHVAFGALEKAREAVSVRSHGSRFESIVPILAYGAPEPPEPYERNLDLGRLFTWEA
jgi:phosphonoacetate hydrolase